MIRAHGVKLLPQAVQVFFAHVKPCNAILGCCQHFCHLAAHALGQAGDDHNLIHDLPPYFVKEPGNPQKLFHFFVMGTPNENQGGPDSAL